MADKNLRSLVVGDVITTIHYHFATIFDDNNELIPFEAEEIVVSKDTTFAEVELGDGVISTSVGY